MLLPLVMECSSQPKKFLPEIVTSNGTRVASKHRGLCSVTGTGNAATTVAENEMLGEELDEDLNTKTLRTPIYIDIVLHNIIDDI